MAACKLPAKHQSRNLCTIGSGLARFAYLRAGLVLGLGTMLIYLTVTLVVFSQGPFSLHATNSNTLNMYLPEQQDKNTTDLDFVLFNAFANSSTSNDGKVINTSVSYVDQQGQSAEAAHHSFDRSRRLSTIISLKWLPNFTFPENLGAFYYFHRSRLWSTIISFHSLPIFTFPANIGAYLLSLFTNNGKVATKSKLGNIIAKLEDMQDKEYEHALYSSSHSHMSSITLKHEHVRSETTWVPPPSLSQHMSVAPSRFLGRQIAPEHTGLSQTKAQRRLISNDISSTSGKIPENTQNLAVPSLPEFPGKYQEIWKTQGLALQLFF